MQLLQMENLYQAARMIMILFTMEQDMLDVSSRETWTACHLGLFDLLFQLYAYYNSSVSLCPVLEFRQNKTPCQAT